MIRTTPLAVAACVLHLVTLQGSPALAGTEAVAPNMPFFLPPIQIGASPVVTAGAAASTQATDSIVSSLDQARLFCARIEEAEFRIDCLSERFAAVAADMPATGDYADARQALLDASVKLNDLARRNQSTTRPRANARDPRPEGIATTRPLVPVRPEALAAAGAEAAAIIEEVETVLLRSTESSERRRVHYERIAAAVGSNKVLLRSL